MKNSKEYQKINTPEPEIILDDDLYTIEWSDIENAEMEYENYLNDIENFFSEEFDDEDPF